MNTFQTSSSSNIVKLSVINHKSSLEHAHRDIELIYVIKGGLQVKISGENYHLSSSEIILINSNEFHSFQSNQDNLFVMIHFNYDELTSLLSQRNLSFSRNSSKQNSAHHEMKIAIEELLTIYMKQDPGSALEFLEKAYKISSLLISKLMKKNNQQTIDHSVTLKGHDERLADIMDYIQSNFREPLSLDDVAGLYFLSSPYLSKFFKKQTGKTFSQYVNEVRLAHAVHELSNTDKLITRVALDNGFPNLAAFNRVFHEQYHIKPVDYRKQMQVDKKEGTSIVESDQESSEAWIELKNYLTETARKTPVETELFSSTLSEQKKVKVENSSPITKNWNKLINVGYAKDLLNSDMQEQIKQLQNEIGFTYARFWGLFGDDMLVEDRSGGKISYNFTNTNKLLDFLIQNKLKPFIEIGPKPKCYLSRLKKKLLFRRLVKNHQGNGEI